MMLKILPCLIIICLSGCSSYNNAFECKVGKGVNCTSVSHINQMLDSGTLNEFQDNTKLIKVKRQIIKVSDKTPFPMILPTDLHNSVVERIPETTLRIWVAPYVSAKDGYIEAQYVHEVLEKGSWVERG